MTLPDESRDQKVKEFGIGWCILHRMAADNGKGDLHLIGLKTKSLSPYLSTLDLN
jgi:hypothetical protein